MDFTAHVENLRIEAERLAAVAELGLDAAVPSCPGWTVRDVVSHTGEVYHHKIEILRGGLIEEPPERVSPPDTDLLAWFVDAAAMLGDALAAAGPEQPAWTWFEEDQTSGFWGRRMAQETLIHRIDVELAHEVVTAVDPALATDGADEIIMTMMTGTPDWSDVTSTDRTARLVTSDTRSQWDLRLVTFSGLSPRSGMEFIDEPSLLVETFDEEPGTVIAGPAEQLDRYLWGRGPGSGLLVVTGDADMVDVVRQIAADVTQ